MFAYIRCHFSNTTLEWYIHSVIICAGVALAVSVPT